MNINFRSYAQMHCLLRSAAFDIPNSVDLIIGLPRSGIAPAVALASHLNTPYQSLPEFVAGLRPVSGKTRPLDGDFTTESQARHILLVDDAVALGREMRSALSTLKKSSFAGNVTTLAVYASSVGRHLVDIYLEVVSSPRIFEWNVLNHWILENACVDIDGVLCRDPRSIELMFPWAYQRFLETVPVRARPKYKIAHIVSSRQEKYRKQTEKWLGMSRIRYKNLHLMPNTSALDRAMSRPHAEFKASVYRNVPASLFIESDNEQAVAISRLTSKPVLSWNVAVMVSDGSATLHGAAKVALAGGLVKRLVRAVGPQHGRALL